MLSDVDKKTIARGADPSVTDSFAIDYKVRPYPEKVTIRTYAAELVTEANGRRNYRGADRQEDVTIPYYIDFYPVESVRFPFAYVLMVPDPDILSLMKLHGIKMEKLTQQTKLNVQSFEISDLKGASRLNQGHYNNTISGKYVEKIS